MAEYRFNGMIFDYNPSKIGKNYGVKVSVQLRANTNHEYKVRPNPASFKRPNDEAKFLLAAITAAAPAFNAVTNTWPATVQFTWDSEDYTLEPR